MLGVRIKNYSISFGEKDILKNISFDITQGEIVSILGPSGSGKSTILRSIASLLEDYEGEIFINDHCLIKNGKKQCHKDLGYIFQDYALFPHLDVKENIAFALHKLNSKQKEKKVDELLKQFDLSEHKNKQIHELSGGQQQRVSIARVLAYEPKVLLLDEPFANLDTLLRNKTKIWLKNLIRDLKLSAILVTHDQKEALSMSDKIAIINNKTIEQFGTPSELFEKPNSLYVANFLSEINELPEFACKDLKLDCSKKNILRVNNTKITNEKTAYKLSIDELLYCGDYNEVIATFGKKNINSKVKAKVYIDESVDLNKELYLKIKKEDIISIDN